MRIVRAAGSLSVMAALALMQTGTARADGPPDPAPVTHTARHPHLRPQHHPMIPPARTTHAPVVTHAPADPPAAPADPPAPRNVPIVVDPPAAFPGASVLLSIASGCKAPTTVTSTAFSGPAVLAAGAAPGLTGSAQVDSVATAGTRIVSAQCSGGVRASGVLRVLSPAQLGAVHAGGGWGAGMDRAEPGRRSRVDRPLDIVLAAGLALTGFLLTILVRQRSRTDATGSGADV